MPGVSTNPLHLYRALLRECTYLPDSIARTRIRDHVISRFRAYTPQKHREASRRDKQKIPSSEPPLDPHRQHVILRNARRGLYTLQRANEGYEKALLRVLGLTYGQIGKRRHELLEQLFAQVALPGGQDTTNVPVKDWEVGEKYHFNAKLDALMRSRMRYQGKFTLRYPAKMGNMQIPKTNTWGLPTPQKRVKNLQRRRYGKLMEGMVAPLPEQEWNHLQSLASDRTAIEDRIPRRARAHSEFQHEDSSELDDSFLVGGPEKGSTHETFGNGRPHKMTKRFMQSIWQVLFNDCPRMTWNSTQNVWDVEWGFMQLKESTEDIIQEADGNRDASLFGDIDMAGSTSNLK